jgi:hypothetical protein
MYIVYGTTQMRYGMCHLFIDRTVRTYCTTQCYGHFSRELDPVPRIRTTDLRIRILLFSSVALKMPTKISLFAYYVLFECTFTSGLQR